MSHKIRIIDNKKILLTDDEYKVYKTMCRAHDCDEFRGEELFRDLFAVDGRGYITFLKPPSKGSLVAVDIYMYLVSIMVHQHLGVACDEVQKFLKDGRELVKELRELLETVKKNGE